MSVGPKSGEKCDLGSRHVIAPIDLADATAGAVLLTAWLWTGSRICCGGRRTE